MYIYTLSFSTIPSGGMIIPNFIFGILILFAVLFYQLRQSDTAILLSILLISLWGYVTYIHWKKSEDLKENENSETLQKITSIPTDIGKTSLPSNIIDLQFLPKQNTKYVQKNPLLVDILRDIRFVRMFDKARYYQLVLAMDRFQKAYIYMLVRRYRIQDAMQGFYDLQDHILELLYSFIVVTPVKLRHTYGLEPHKRIHLQIEQFLKISKTMVDVLRNFSELELKLPYFPEHIPKTYESERKNVLP